MRTETPAIEWVGSLRYTQGRLTTGQAFEDSTLFPTDLQFSSPSDGRVRSRRFVYHAARMYELWSDNSTLHVFPPGLSLRGPALESSATESGRLYNGSLGRFDFTRHAQFLFGMPAYAPFICRPSRIPASDPRYAMGVPLTLYWTHKKNTYRGTLSAAGVAAVELARQSLNVEFNELRDFAPEGSEARGLYPTASATPLLEKLQKPQSWADAVDIWGQLQRLLSQRDGWGRWMRYENVPHAPTGPVPDADDNLMGIWVNHVDERLVQRWKAARVPCFVAAIHCAQS
uniref:Uncharacterized protein n=1 Tax=Mycena chlorophos TaxID=658473 RepID=A0ABQ0LEI3_MYCCL|nr:predicted protein [Mycena chlorophos]